MANNKNENLIPIQTVPRCKIFDNGQMTRCKIFIF